METRDEYHWYNKKPQRFKKYTSLGDKTAKFDWFRSILTTCFMPKLTDLHIILAISNNISCFSLGPQHQTSVLTFYKIILHIFHHITTYLEKQVHQDVL